MSLKEETKGIFTRYGLNDQEIRILFTYLSHPQTTSSMVSEYLTLDYETIVKPVTAKLISEGFIKELPGIIARYIPLEPYFSLFVKESSAFREEIEKIKDGVLEDQSKRFQELENIKNESITEVDSAFQTQVDEFFKVSDEHDSDKEGTIEKGRDRFSTTSKALENSLHSIIDQDYQELDSDIKIMDSDAANLWNENSQKFTRDNTDLNEKLDQISDSHVSQTDNLEKNMQSIINNLNSQLKTIADGFINKSESGANDAKDGINKIISDLLKDFTERVNNLENEMKKDLDNHVEAHKENAQGLKPTLEEILDKYMSRMHDVVEELKKLITKLLLEHIDHLKSTTDKMQEMLHDKVEVRQTQLVGQVKSFEDNTVTLIDNLKDISAKLTDLGTILASRGSAFKALFTGKHKQWVVLNEDIQERVTKVSGSMKDNFTASTTDYIENTNTTKGVLKGEITSILSDENESLAEETNVLDKKAQESVNAELEGLAGDLSGEIDDTLKKNIEHCKDTTVKLKDLIGSNFSTHQADYDAAINRHLKNSLEHYSDSDREVKNNVDSWYSEMDKDHNKANNDITTETTQQNTDINNHRNATKEKNVEHSKTFESDTEATKTKQTNIYTTRLQKVRDDFDIGKKKISEKIDSEIDIFTNECKEMNDKLHAMLEDHKSKYQENAKSLQQSMTKTITDNTQNTKDAIADFTLQFMNSIDESNEIALNNEEKLNDIFQASNSVIETKETDTWHVIGMPAIIETVADALGRTKSSIIIVTHEVIPKILEMLSQTAYKKKSQRFFYTTHWTPEYEGILSKMKTLGNIQFRQLKSKGDFIAMTKDAEEVLLAPVAGDQDALVAMVSTQDGYCKLYSQIIGPVFQANSRPI